jgi:hypothetical protein
MTAGRRRAPGTGSAMVAVLVLGLLLAGCVAAPAPPAPFGFGVLGASCDAGRAAALRRAGVDTAEVAVAWDRFEPAPGSYDSAYIGSINGRLGTCRAAGLKIVLSLGLQYPPDWVRRLPGGTFTGPRGGVPPDGEIDIVFSGAVRRAVEGYLARLASEVGFVDVVAVRIGTNRTGELGYPGPNAAGDRYWAFGGAAQLGDDLAAGMSVAPLPGWTPGDRSWRGGPVSDQQMAAWFEWYTGSLVTAASWQIDRLRAAGFGGRFHVPLAGRGVQPTDLRTALSSRLEHDRGDPDGALGRGLHYTEQLPLLAAVDQRLRAAQPSAGIDIDITGIDDDTAVRARALPTPQDSCRADDVEDLLTRPDTGAWSAQRWTIANARRAGLPVIGENPGPPGMAFTGGSPWSDPVAEQLRRAKGYAADCGLRGFGLAFEDTLFDPASGLTLDGYAQWISAARRG